MYGRLKAVHKNAQLIEWNVSQVDARRQAASYSKLRSCLVKISAKSGKQVGRLREIPAPV